VFTLSWSTMTSFILDHEIIIRLGFFGGVLAIMAVWEALAPRRARSLSRLKRWPGNLAVTALNTALLRLLLPMTAVGLAVLGQARGWGILNTVERPEWFAVAASLLALDFAIYLQHVIFHAVPALWRLHRMHHADLDFDVTTGTRFHPLESLLSMLLKFAVIVVLGPPAASVVLFEVVLNATSMFNHSNVHLPSTFDALLRWFMVTPDMHRVHHSVHADEANSNFGFNLPWWDRLLGTYRSQPQHGHEQMVIGLRTMRDPKQCGTLSGMLALPFAGPATDYAINRRPGSDAHEDG
jgi:sterol desaturase/sphingolipid hydroxylase (fatty acid hydroxylase superfamily)